MCVGGEERLLGELVVSIRMFCNCYSSGVMGKDELSDMTLNFSEKSLLAESNISSRRGPVRATGGLHSFSVLLICKSTTPEQLFLTCWSEHH